MSDMTDSNRLIKYCLDNKINITAIDELLKLGFNSLDALKLVNMKDFSSQNIPIGQRWINTFRTMNMDELPEEEVSEMLPPPFRNKRQNHSDINDVKNVKLVQSVQGEDHTGPIDLTYH